VVADMKEGRGSRAKKTLGVSPRSHEKPAFRQVASCDLGSGVHVSKRTYTSRSCKLTLRSREVDPGPNVIVVAHERLLAADHFPLRT
jgi:hypothetical protein